VKAITYNEGSFFYLPMSATPHRQRLPNGITLIITPSNTTDIVAGRIFVRAGSYFDPTDRSGMSNLLATLLTKGTTELSAMEIAHRIETVGAGVGTEANNDHIEVSFKSVTADFADILRLVGNITRRPQFAPQQIALEQKLAIERIRSQSERPLTLAFQQLRESIYQNHPYAQALLGTTATVAKITQAELLAFHQTYFRPDLVTISIAGNVDLAAAEQLVGEVFGDWLMPAVPAPEIASSTISFQPQQKTLAKDTKQSIVMLGHLSVAATDEDYFALRIIDSYLGSGLSSRLFVELREKRGLAYEVASVFSTKVDRSIFAVYMGTANDKVTMAINGLQAELARLCVARLSEEELADTKTKLLGKYALTKQTNGQLAYIYGWYESLGLGWDFDQKLNRSITSLTTAQLEDVAVKYFDRPYYLSVVGG
jgi:zinc protease